MRVKSQLKRFPIFHNFHFTNFSNISEIYYKISFNFNVQFTNIAYFTQQTHLRLELDENIVKRISLKYFPIYLKSDFKKQSVNFRQLQEKIIILFIIILMSILEKLHNFMSNL